MDPQLHTSIVDCRVPAHLHTQIDFHSSLFSSSFPSATHIRAYTSESPISVSESYTQQAQQTQQAQKALSMSAHVMMSENAAAGESGREGHADLHLVNQHAYLSSSSSSSSNAIGKNKTNNKKVNE